MTRLVPRLTSLLALAALVTALPACDTEPVGDGPFAEAEANDGRWVFVDVEGARCRDGSATGLGVRLQSDSDNLVVFFEGGGACFSDGTCATNPAAFGEATFRTFASQGGEAGVFDTDASNPVGDWNMVYVPYCTGDLHGGSATDVTVPGVAGVQQFVGAQNVDRYLELLAPYFDDMDKVLVAGRSAGGGGALINFASVADAFPTATPILLDDSLPVFFEDNVFSPVLGGAFTQTWNLPAAFPADASALFAADGLQGIYAYYDARYPDAAFGLSSHLQDGIIRIFLGAGQSDGTVTGAEYAAGLRDLRAKLPDSWATYYATGEFHTFLGTPSRYTGASAGVTYSAWLAALIDGQAPNVDPEVAVRVAAR